MLNQHGTKYRLWFIWYIHSGGCVCCFSFTKFLLRHRISTVCICCSVQALRQSAQRGVMTTLAVRCFTKTGQIVICSATHCFGVFVAGSFTHREFLTEERLYIARENDQPWPWCSSCEEIPFYQGNLRIHLNHVNVRNACFRFLSNTKNKTRLLSNWHWRQMSVMASQITGKCLFSSSPKKAPNHSVTGPSCMRWRGSPVFPWGAICVLGILFCFVCQIHPQMIHRSVKSSSASDLDCTVTDGTKK